MSEAPLDVQISVIAMANRALLADCLASVPDACEGLEWALTVIDNVSEDGSAALVEREFEWAGLIRNERRLGFGANHNQVLRPVLEAGSARYALVLNDDTLLAPRSMRALVDYCDADSRLGAAGPLIVASDGRRQVSYFRFPTALAEVLGALVPGRRRRTATRGGWLNGSCLLLRAEALQVVGVFDERFFAFYEDTDLGLRLMRGGWHAALCERAQIVHHGHQTVGGPELSGRMERQVLRSRFLYFKKHFGPARALAVAYGTRAALLPRAAKAFAEATLGSRGSSREINRGQARLLVSLARYNPRSILEHERASEASP